MSNSYYSKLRLPCPKSLLSDGKYFARIYGKGEPLLLIHGNHGSGYVFDRILDALMEHHTVIMPDLPGHGFGPKMPEGFLDDEQLAVSYCIEIMNKLGYNQYIAAGHSLGGMIALQMAIDYPRNVRSVIMLDSFVRFTERDAPPLLNIEKYPDNEAVYQTLIDEAFGFGPGVNWHEWFDVRRYVSDIQCPVLDMIGESNPSTDKLFADFLETERKDYPERWCTVRIPKSGHFIQIEQPDFVIKEISSFFDKFGL